MDDMKKMELTELPQKINFYSKLTEEHISDKDYEKAKNIWKHFNLKNMQDYHDLYLQTDVLLLADVFENFRRQCKEIYNLDPVHYYTSPGFSFDSMLKYTKIELDLLWDEDMYNMIEKGIRGGICQVSTKHVKANNKYLSDYDESKNSVFIMYFDANNLYGLAMSQMLPYKDFKWSDDLQTEEDILNYDGDGDTGYILQVDLDYPRELHDKHNDYPLLPEARTVKSNEISEVTKDIYNKYTGKDPRDSSSKKLILDLHDKTKYIIHISKLKEY
jgi:hypothetical protein